MRKCPLTTFHSNMADNDKKIIYTYKDPKTLAKLVDERGKILPRTKSGLTAKEQKLATREIKRARQLGLIAYTQTIR